MNEDTRSDGDGQYRLRGIPKVESMTVNQGFLPDRLVYGLARLWRRFRARKATATT